MKDIAFMPDSWNRKYSIDNFFKYLTIQDYILNKNTYQDEYIQQTKANEASDIETR